MDAIGRANPTPALGVPEATNLCGEQTLLPYESCTLGSFCLPRFVRTGRVDFPALEEAAAMAVRFLDNVAKINRHPLPRVAQTTRLNAQDRPVGDGPGRPAWWTWARLPYDSPQAEEAGGQVMAAITRAARVASVELGKKRGDFPVFPQSLWRAQGLTHMRNATLTTIAPTGTLSLLLGCSSGLEPYYARAAVKKTWWR